MQRIRKPVTVMTAPSQVTEKALGEAVRKNDISHLDVHPDHLGRLMHDVDDLVNLGPRLYLVRSYLGLSGIELRDVQIRRLYYDMKYGETEGKAPKQVTAEELNKAIFENKIFHLRLQEAYLSVLMGEVDDLVNLGSRELLQKAVDAAMRFPGPFGVTLRDARTKLLYYDMRYGETEGKKEQV